jgi:predicted metal-dependent phosphoesterase TrpH
MGARAPKSPWASKAHLTIPVLISTAAIAGALFPLAPIRDAVTLRSVHHVRLVRGPWYLLLSPIYDSWDAVTLFSAREHIVLLTLAVVGYVFWRWRIFDTSSRGVVRREVVRAAIALVLLLAWYGVGAVAPRPMVSLEVDDPDAVVVDFHSHTDASHDGRRGFSAERNREWHRSAGFNVAYISDHGTYAAVREALPRNPVRAGEGTVLLPAFETRNSDQHLNLLGFSAEDEYGHAPPDILEAIPGAVAPRSLLTIPAAMEGAAAQRRIMAVELIDGSPLGLEFGTRQRTELLKLCTRLGAAPVAGSNNHGWGRTAPGWTILRIPGWRNLTPVALDQAILATLAAGDRGRVVVIERAPPVPAGESIRLATTALTWNPFRTLPIPDQLVWMTWAWAAWWIAGRVRRLAHVGRPTMQR